VTRLLRKYLDPFLSAHGAEVTRHVRQKLHRLAWCHTDMYGGHEWECGSCGAAHHSFNGCRDRACPACAVSNRGPWLQLMQSWMLPIDYYQCVFTTPHALNPVIGTNVALCYRLHAEAVRESLGRVAADPTAGVAARLGMIMVLHTWGQLMLRHIHTHVVLPGGGISLETGQWVTFPPRKFFLNPAVLMETYRDLYLKKLLRRYRAGQLALPPELSPLQQDESAFRAWLAPLQQQPWVIHCGTPQDTFRQDGAFRYLSNYVTGTAISDARIVKDEHGEVTIRFKDYRDHGVRKTTTMSGVEFVRRFALHIMPPQLRRVRYGGFLGPSERKAALQLARTALGVPLSPESNPSAPTTEQSRSDLSPADPSAQHAPAATPGGAILDNAGAESDKPVAPQILLSPPSGEAAAAVSTTATPESPAEDPEADTNMRCPNCGQQKLRWIQARPAESGWLISHMTIPRRARERIARELLAPFTSTVPAPQRPPPLAGAT
jgi:hypothetical protein